MKYYRKYLISIFLLIIQANYRCITCNQSIIRFSLLPLQTCGTLFFVKKISIFSHDYRQFNFSMTISQNLYTALGLMKVRYYSILTIFTFVIAELWDFICNGNVYDFPSFHFRYFFTSCL